MEKAYPTVSAHEGRHRNMTLDYMGQPKSLVRLIPENLAYQPLFDQDALAPTRETFRSILERGERKVIPQSDFTNRRPMRGLTEDTLPYFDNLFSAGGGVRRRARSNSPFGSF
jgi:hypothetical protein